MAVNVVMNYEDGSVPSFELGDNGTETGLTGAYTGSQVKNGRDLAAERMFKCGVAVWRLMRLFQERSLAMTLFRCAQAVERDPNAATAIRTASHDVRSHGWRWVKHFKSPRTKSARTSERPSSALRRRWAIAPMADTAATAR